MITTKLLVDVLRKVPEKKLRIFDLAPQLVGAEGKVDFDKALAQQGEIRLAVAEVSTYVKGVRHFADVIGCVRRARQEAEDEE